MSKTMARVYQTSSIIILCVMLPLCLFFRWDHETTIAVLLLCLVVSAPAVISLNAICWLLKRVALSVAFAWVLLLAMIPLLVLMSAVLFVNTLPGDTGFLMVIGMGSAYAAIFGHGLSVAQLFKSLL